MASRGPGKTKTSQGPPPQSSRRGHQDPQCRGQKVTHSRARLIITKCLLRVETWVGPGDIEAPALRDLIHRGLTRPRQAWPGRTSGGPHQALLVLSGPRCLSSPHSHHLGLCSSNSAPLLPQGHALRPLSLHLPCSLYLQGPPHLHGPTLTGFSGFSWKAASSESCSLTLNLIKPSPLLHLFLSRHPFLFLSFTYHSLGVHFLVCIYSSTSLPWLLPLFRG